jgi:NADH:ubiquinone oxidoreductase subunit 4 (subunit M)
VVLGATYMLRFARRVVFGDANAVTLRVADLGARELAALALLLVPIAAIGVRPAPMMARVEPAVAAIAKINKLAAPTVVVQRSVP